MGMSRNVAAALCATVLLTFVAIGIGEERADLAAIWRIKDEGLNRSEVMKTLSYLTDVHGPRLTGSPGIRRAQEWAQKQLRDWGLENVHTEKYEFGRGWELRRFSAHMIEPAYA